MSLILESGIPSLISINHTSNSPIVPCRVLAGEKVQCFRSRNDLKPALSLLVITEYNCIIFKQSIAVTINNFLQDIYSCKYHVSPAKRDKVLTFKMIHFTNFEVNCIFSKVIHSTLNFNYSC